MTVGYLEWKRSKIPQWFETTGFSECRDIERPLDFRRVVIRKSRDGFFRQRDFRSLVVQKSRDVERPQDVRSQVVWKSRDVERLRDFWSVIVQKSRNYLNTKLINSHFVNFQSTLSYSKKDYSSMMYNKKIFCHSLLCFWRSSKGAQYEVRYQVWEKMFYVKIFLVFRMWSQGINLGLNSLYLLNMWRILFNSWSPKK